MTDELEIDQKVLIAIMQQDHPKEYMLALQKATIMKQNEVIDQLKNALGATNGNQDQGQERPSSTHA
jgi:hypothetical protein